METGRLSPSQRITRFRLSSKLIGRCSYLLSRACISQRITELNLNVEYCLKSNYSDRNLEILERQMIIRNAVQSTLNLI